jgi:hypothetical protein
MEVPLGHAIPPAGLGDGAATREHRERCIGVVPQIEPYFPPSVRRTRRQEMEVGIDSTTISDEDVHNAQSRHFYTRALL